MSPPYRQGLGACFQMAACARRGHIDCNAYLKAKASLWHSTELSVSRTISQHAYREHTLPEVYQRQSRKVGIDLMATPSSLDAAWAVKACKGGSLKSSAGVQLRRHREGRPDSAQTPLRAPHQSCRHKGIAWSLCRMLSIAYSIRERGTTTELRKYLLKPPLKPPLSPP